MLKPASPRFLWNDLRAFWRDRPRHQYFAATMAVLIPIAILVAFYLDSRTNVRPAYTITYINSWPANRSDAEIKAKQQADLRERRRREAERQEQFRKADQALRRLGI
ncbi:MAG: hypothetical protein ACT4OE_02995 [Sphingosinicella sp.]